MENKINIAKLLRNAPCGTKLWSPICGDCYFKEIDEYGMIVIDDYTHDHLCQFFPNGKEYDKDDAECLLFPSKDCRTWENFNAPWKRKCKHFEPFQRVLVARTTNNHYIWRGAIYSHYDTTHKCHILADGQVKSDNDILSFEGNEDMLGKEVQP